jgi:HEAT repeat protein
VVADFNKLMEMLQSPNSRTRFDACEELRVAPSLPATAIAALEKAANDPDRSVRDSAASALKVHKPPAAKAPAPKAPAASPATQFAGRELLEQLVKLQEKQNASLTEIQKHTGCMYAYLIVSVILGVLLALYYLFILMPMSSF